jgi:hypothetical protein
VRVCDNFEHERGKSRAMNPLSRSSSFATVGSVPVRRPSVSSRLSFAISTAAERGEAQNGSGNAAEHNQIEEEIAEIKRYEVRCPERDGEAPGVAVDLRASADMATGLYNNRLVWLRLPMRLFQEAIMLT